MSQAGIVDFIGTHPEIPTLFVADIGTAIPIANTIEILGNAVAAHSVPLQTTASGNTVNINVQYASAAASSVAANAGVASFNSLQFTVDANGFVSFSGGSVTEAFAVDTFTAPGTNPVLPNGSGIITVTGGQVAAGTTANVIRTDSLAANTYTIEIQRSQAVASSTIGDNGVAHFNSTYFTVDANGFVSINGGAIGETITGNTGGALSPTAGNWNILGTSTASGTTPVQTAGSGSTLTVQVQKAQAIASTNATNVGLAAFNSAQFTVDGNGFVSTSGSAIPNTITGQSGGPLSPSAGNWNIFGAVTAAGTSPVVTSGSGSTLTVDVQTSQALAAADATKIGLANFDSSSFSVTATGFVTASGTGILKTLTGNSGGAISPTAGNINTLGTGSITIAGSGSTLTTQLTGLTNHAVLVGAGTATITNVGPTATAGQVLQSAGSSADPVFSTATYPSTTTINQILYSSSANVVAGLSTANQGVLTTGTSGIPVITSIAANGQLIIGSTSGAPAAATLTAGTGISITNGSNSITIASTGSPMAWTDEATSFSAVAGNGYFITGTATATLPASPSQGNVIAFSVDAANILTIQANTGQVIRIGSGVSASAGTAANNARGDSVTLVYRSSDSAWIASSVIGTWTIT